MTGAKCCETTETHCSIEAIQWSIKHVCTEGSGSALLSRHHQCGATWLVHSIARCIVGQEQLDAVDVTRERCSMKRSPAGEREREEWKQKVEWSINSAAASTHTHAHTHTHAYLSLASLQPAMSDPIASSSSEAHDSWSFTLWVWTQTGFHWPTIRWRKWRTMKSETSVTSVTSQYYSKNKKTMIYSGCFHW